MIEQVKKEVDSLLGSDDSGHGTSHVNRVLKLALKFADKHNANKEIVSLIALLHDVDDYKLFGQEQANNLTNAKAIMDKVKIDIEVKKAVLSQLQCIGYSKSLKGIRPTTIEGMVVSDADMCDALGVNGIIRTYTYSLKHNKPFFDAQLFPKNKDTIESYTKVISDSSVCHFFEKILKLKDMMMTEAGKQEALSRHQIIVDVLYHLFEEEDVIEWKEYLDSYLKNN